MNQSPGRKTLWIRVLRVIAVAALGMAVVGCFNLPKARRSITADDPAEKIPAIKASVRLHDRTAIAHLVEDLDNDDPAVRFYAIRALEDLTGETFQYQYYDDDLERRPAVDRWRQWLAEQNPPPTTTTSPAVTSQPGSS